MRQVGHLLEQYEYYVTRQENKGNPLLRLHGNIQQFYTVDSYMQINNNTNETHCCVSIATIAKQTRHNVPLHIRKLRVYLLSCLISDFRRGVNEIFALLGRYAAHW